MTIAASIAEWAVPLEIDDVPATTRRHACLHVLDGLGCATAASHLDEATHAVAVALQMTGPQEATIIGDGGRVSAPAAALANGALIHALDFDDTHAGALVHPTAAVLPAALAAGEEVSASGADVLAAVVAGYEAVIRLGLVVRHGFHERGFHATGVCGVFAAALVAAKLMRLTVAQSVNALGIAGSAAAGSLEFLQSGTATKQLHPGLAAMNGVVAARLAAAGAQGPPSIFEGRYGLFRAYLGADVNPLDVTETLGDVWETSRIAIKPYPICHLSLAPIEALRHLGRERVADIQSVTFEVPDGSVPIVCEPATEKRDPPTAYAAKFSLPYCAAVMLLDGRLAVDSFSDQMRARADVRELAGRIGYEAPRDAFAGPPASAPGFVRVAYRDGSSVRNPEPVYASPRGAVDESAVREKFRANGGASRLEDAILSLEKLPNLKGLLA